MIKPVQSKDAWDPSDSYQVPPSRLPHLDIPPPSYLPLYNATTQPISPIQTMPRPAPLHFQPLQVSPVQSPSLQILLSRRWLPPAPL
uniref:Uncharacterized protein n=1 Tax=Peronospora matthiolae TaxID=2874970 RepID=A0AAV1TI59_9STRA